MTEGRKVKITPTHIYPEHQSVVTPYFNGVVFTDDQLTVHDKAVAGWAVNATTPMLCFEHGGSPAVNKGKGRDCPKCRDAANVEAGAIQGISAAIDWIKRNLPNQAIVSRVHTAPISPEGVCRYLCNLKDLGPIELTTTLDALLKAERLKALEEALELNCRMRCETEAHRWPCERGGRERGCISYDAIRALAEREEG